MEKGNGIAAAATGLGLGEGAAAAGLMESTTTVTSVVTGVGATAGESLTKAVADKASEAAIEEARQRLTRGSDDQVQQADASAPTARSDDTAV